MTYSEIVRNGVSKVNGIDEYYIVIKDKKEHLSNAMKAFSCALGNDIQDFEE
jgi:hypothetical protein